VTIGIEKVKSSLNYSIKILQPKFFIKGFG